MPIIIFSLIVLLFSVIIHEIAHGSVAYSLGDPTAKEQGRLTLNPLKHLDPFGSVILPLLLLLLTLGRGPIFGWAKPVPVNPFNFRDKKWGIFKVSIAGPLMNFALAIIFGLLIRFFALPQSVFLPFSVISLYNFAWGIFNLLPLPPLDGYHILLTLLPERFSGLRLFLQQYGMILFLFFIFFFINWIFLGAQALYNIVSGSGPAF